MNTGNSPKLSEKLQEKQNQYDREQIKLETKRITKKIDSVNDPTMKREYQTLLNVRDEEMSIKRDLDDASIQRAADEAVEKARLQKPVLEPKPPLGARSQSRSIVPEEKIRTDTRQKMGLAFETENNQLLREKNHDIENKIDQELQRQNERSVDNSLDHKQEPQSLRERLKQKHREPEPSHQREMSRDVDRDQNRNIGFEKTSDRDHKQEPQSLRERLKRDYSETAQDREMTRGFEPKPDVKPR